MNKLVASKVAAASAVLQQTAMLKKSCQAPKPGSRYVTKPSGANSTSCGRALLVSSPWRCLRVEVKYDTLLFFDFGSNLLANQLIL